MSRHFLYLTNNRLVSVAARGKRIVARREFAVSGAGAAEFERYVAGMSAVPTHLFTDLPEEDFRLDTIPHVGQRDRDAVVGRKLSQIFRNTPYRHAILQGREAEGRRDDRVVYTAITNPEVLRPWLDILDRLKVPLEGVHSAAVFSAVLLEELDLVFAHTLLVTFSPGESMRQTYFRDREIKFSRLTPVDLQPGQSLGAMVAEETTRTWQYLDSLRHFGVDDRLEVCVIVHAKERAGVQPELRDFAQIQYRVLDIEQVSAKLGLRTPPLGSTAEEVLIHLFLMRPAPNHFASSEMRRYATVRRIRILLQQVSVAALAASLGWGGYNLSRVLRSTEVDQRVTTQLRDLNREYDEITRNLPSFGVGGSTMRDAVAFYNGTIRPFPMVGDFLRPISGVLRDFPQVRLTQMSWQVTEDIKAASPLAAIPSRNAPPVKALAKAGEIPQPTPADDQANPQFAGGRFEVAFVEGTVSVPHNDFRAAVELVERLAADVSRLKGFRADVVDSPLDVRPTLALQGRHAEKEPPVMEPRFMIRIVRERAGAPA